jgi:hypothetical protein
MLSMTPDHLDLPNDLFSSSTANAKAATIAIAGAPDGCLAAVAFSKLVGAYL